MKLITPGDLVMATRFFHSADISELAEGICHDSGSDRRAIAANPGRVGQTTAHTTFGGPAIARPGS